MTLLTIHGLQKNFGNNRILRGIDLDVEPGEIVSIIGASGSGKTTLLRCVNLLEDFDAGEIMLAGTSIGYVTQTGNRRRLPERELARQRAMTGMVFQSFNLFPHLSALNNVTLGLTKVRGMDRKAATDIAMTWLSRVGLVDRVTHFPSQLSGGQQQRVAIARALAMQPKLLLLDEITSALDPELVGEVLDVIRLIASDGTTMLIVTHEMAFARDVSTRVVFMDEGQISEQGSPSHVFNHSRLPRLREFLRRFNTLDAKEPRHESNN